MSNFVNIDCKTNCDYTFQAILLESDGVTPTDIATYVFEGAVENGVCDCEDSVMDITCQLNTDGTDGVVDIIFTRLLLSGLTPGRYKYEVVYTDDNSLRDTLVEGTLNLERGIVDND